MALQICTESFQGELEGGIALNAQKGVTVLDDSKPAEAKMLKAWGAFFAPAASTHVYPEKAEAAPKPRRKYKPRKATPRKATPAEEKGVAATVTAEATPEVEAKPEAPPFGLSNARLRDETEHP